MQTSDVFPLVCVYGIMFSQQCLGCLFSLCLGAYYTVSLTNPAIAFCSSQRFARVQYLTLVVTECQIPDFKKGGKERNQSVLFAQRAFL